MASTRKPNAPEDEVTVKEGKALPAPKDEPETLVGVDAVEAPDEEETAAGPADESDAEDADDDDLDDLPPGAPPEADVVALRALAVASLLRRLALEEREAPAKELQGLKDWVDEHGLFAAFSADSFELFDAEAGAWTADDLSSVGWASEELYVLLWALGRCGAPTLFDRAQVGALLSTLPDSGDPGAFVDGAVLRDGATLETARVLHEVLHESARSEAWARDVLRDGSVAEDDEALEEVLASAEAEGFERARVTKEEGAHAAAVQGLRRYSRSLLTGLFEEGSPHAAFSFDPGKLESLDDEGLALFLAAAQLRADTLEWLTEGDEFADDEGDDEDEEDESSDEG